MCFNYNFHSPTFLLLKITKGVKELLFMWVIPNHNFPCEINAENSGDYVPLIHLKLYISDFEPVYLVVKAITSSSLVSLDSCVDHNILPSLSSSASRPVEERQQRLVITMGIVSTFRPKRALHQGSADCNLEISNIPQKFSVYPWQ